MRYAAAGSDVSAERARENEKRRRVLILGAVLALGICASLVMQPAAAPTPASLPPAIPSAKATAGAEAGTRQTASEGRKKAKPAPKQTTAEATATATTEAAGAKKAEERPPTGTSPGREQADSSLIMASAGTFTAVFAAVLLVEVMLLT